jgi:hypothetical protein
MSKAPVILFVYNRPEHTRRTLTSLKQNKSSEETVLYIFADGPSRPADQDLQEKIRQTREVIREEKWCAVVHISESTVNKGLSASIVTGVNEVIAKHGRAIILEDDHVTSPYFLQFMNDALELYKERTEVACISAYIYPVKGRLPETFFLKGADCWGWATWADRWKLYEPDGAKLLKELTDKGLRSAFDFDNSYPYTAMLEDQIAGKNDSWAIRWYAAAFLQNRYCLYPGLSLVRNIGTDGSGIHSGISESHHGEMAPAPVKVELLSPIADHAQAREVVKKYFRSLGKLPFQQRTKQWLKKLLNR